MARLFSGIQPTGRKHIGNLIGAIRQWAEYQANGYEGIYCVVDLHSMATPYEPSEMHGSTLELAALILAAGVDPERSTLFVQSHVPEHTELAWVLGCVTSMGELGRMTQYKDKAGSRDFVPVGIFTYPVLQAGDILLYDAELVPVGDDQRQHLELARDVGARFNSRFGQTFVLPRAITPKAGARLVDLQEPTRKMSTSASSPAGTLYAVDTEKATRKKIMGAVTDSGSEVRAGTDKPGVTGLLELHAALSGDTIAALEDRFADAGYGAFKRSVADVVVAYLEPIWARHDELMADPAELQAILRRGAERARELAVPKMEQVRERTGLLPVR
jgi:tryptophanyl-tRNA synthetase